MANSQRYDEASRRAANLIQDAVQCLIPLVLEQKSPEGPVFPQREENITEIPTNHRPRRMLNSMQSTSSLPGPHMASASPLLRTGTSREDTIQFKMSELFSPYPKRNGSKRSVLKRQYRTPWSHDFFCLSDPESDMSPSLEERCTLQNMGLGRRKVTFPDNNGTHKDFVEGLVHAYPQLADAGGFKLMRCGRNRALVDIAMPSSGYSVRYLRMESGLNKALAYIVPIQGKLVDIKDCKPNDSDTVLEKCKSCNQDLPLYKLESHFNECDGSYVDLTEEDEKEMENEMKTEDEDEDVAEVTSGEESDDFPLQAALQESILTQHHHVPEPATEDQTTSVSNGQDIVNILTALGKAVDDHDGSPASYISVCRSQIWMGARLALSRKSFKPHWRINVKFMDDVGLAEGAVDTGGPKREFFTLVLDYLHSSGLFVGPENGKLLTYSSSAMEKDEYFYAGMIIAMSLVHGGPAPRFLSRTLFEALTESPEKTTVTIEEVPDIKLKENLQKVLTGEEVPDDLEEIIDMSGSRCVLATPEDAHKMALDTAHWYIFGRTRSAFERFKDGLKTLGVYAAMVENKESFVHIMCHQENPLTAEQIKEAFTPVLNLPGSNKRSTENLILCLWENLLFEADDEDSDVSLEKILFFSTGLKAFPPLELRPSPSLCFLHDAEDNGQLSNYPKANTCTNRLYLPTTHKTYHEFKSHMVFGIGASAGFGLP